MAQDSGAAVLPAGSTSVAGSRCRSSSIRLNVGGIAAPGFGVVLRLRNQEPARVGLGPGQRGLGLRPRPRLGSAALGMCRASASTCRLHIHGGAGQGCPNRWLPGSTLAAMSRLSRVASRTCERTCPRNSAAGGGGWGVASRSARSRPSAGSCRSRPGSAGECAGSGSSGWRRRLRSRSSFSSAGHRATGKDRRALPSSPSCSPSLRPFCSPSRSSSGRSWSCRTSCGTIRASRGEHAANCRRSRGREGARAARPGGACAGERVAAPRRSCARPASCSAPRAPSAPPATSPFSSRRRGGAPRAPRRARRARRPPRRCGVGRLVWRRLLRFNRWVGVSRVGHALAGSLPSFATETSGASSLRGGQRSPAEWAHFVALGVFAYDAGRDGRVGIAGSFACCPPRSSRPSPPRSATASGVSASSS